MSKKIIKNDLVTWNKKVLDFSHKYDWYDNLGDVDKKEPEVMLVLDIKKEPLTVPSEVIVYREQLVETCYEDELVKIKSGSV
jgi:hypothetical protein